MQSRVCSRKELLVTGPQAVTSGHLCSPFSGLLGVHLREGHWFPWAGPEDSIALELGGQPFLAAAQAELLRGGREYRDRGALGAGGGEHGPRCPARVQTLLQVGSETPLLIVTSSTA